jgi:hypothetical protein
MLPRISQNRKVEEISTTELLNSKLANGWDLIAVLSDKGKGLL